MRDTLTQEAPPLRFVRGHAVLLESQSAMLVRLKDSESVVLVKRCRVCGSRNAPFGAGVALRKGKVGEWYCREHHQ